MECPECGGDGEILLFISVTTCEMCAGSGKIQNEVEAKGDTDPPGFSLQNAYDTGGGVTITTGPIGTGGDVTITGGCGAATGSGGSITLTGGTGASDWYTDTYTTAVQTPSPSEPSIGMLSGSGLPNKDGIHASIGSLYLSNANETGSIWVKTSGGATDWAPISTLQDHTASVSDGEIGEALDSLIPARDEDLIDYVVEKTKEYDKYLVRYRCAPDHESRRRIDETMRGFPRIGEALQAIAPVHTGVMADMMAMIEQKGQEVTAFISSSRDFADVRKYGEEVGIEWKGKDVTYFGTPFWHSHKMPVGYFIAVSEDRRLVICTITR